MVWQLALSVIPVILAYWRELNRVICIASVVLASVTVLAIIMQNIPLVKKQFANKTSIVPAAGTVKPIDSIGVLGSDPVKVHFVADPFREQFMWNANMHNTNAKNVRHRV